jgi:hypothetical protein
VKIGVKMNNLGTEVGVKMRVSSKDCPFALGTSKFSGKFLKLSLQSHQTFSPIFKILPFWSVASKTSPTINNPPKIT